jgi:hypothetical protein
MMLFFLLLSIVSVIKGDDGLVAQVSSRLRSGNANKETEPVQIMVLTETLWYVSFAG